MYDWAMLQHLLIDHDNGSIFTLRPLVGGNIQHLPKRMWSITFQRLDHLCTL